MAHTGREIPIDPAEPFVDPAVGVGMWSVVIYCLVTGLGVGAFLAVPYQGALVGLIIGLLAGRWLAPELARDWTR